MIAHQPRVISLMFHSTVQGKGGSQAAEDGVALDIVLSGCTRGNLSSKLRVYEQVRIKRASVIQILSKAGQDEPHKIYAEASKFMPARQYQVSQNLEYILHG